jgi:hypothetical protein
MTPESTSRTLDGAVDAFFLHGIDLRGYPTAAKWAIHDLHRDDPALLERVLVSISNADQNTLRIWGHYFNDVTTGNHVLGFARMIENAELTARLLDAIDADMISTQRFFQTRTIADTLERHLGIRPGDARYNEVHAGIIYCAITHPGAITRTTSDEWYRLANRRSLKLIAENMEQILSILPALCQRRNASPDTIEAMLSVTPALAEGAL